MILFDIVVSVPELLSLRHLSRRLHPLFLADSKLLLLLILGCWLITKIVDIHVHVIDVYILKSSHSNTCSLWLGNLSVACIALNLFYHKFFGFNLFSIPNRAVSTIKVLNYIKVVGLLMKLTQKLLRVFFELKKRISFFIRSQAVTQGRDNGIIGGILLLAGGAFNAAWLVEAALPNLLISLY